MPVSYHLSLSLLCAMIAVDAQRASSRQRLDPVNTDLWRGHQKFDPECTNLQFLDAHQALKVEVSEFKGRMIIELDNHQDETDQILRTRKEETDEVLRRRKEETDEVLRSRKEETDNLLLNRKNEVDTILRTRKEEHDKILSANLKTTTTSLTSMQSDIQTRNTEVDRRFNVLTGGVDVNNVQSMGQVGNRVDTLERDLASEIAKLRGEMNTKYNPLKAAHDKLQRDFDELKIAHNSLNNKHQALQNNFNTLDNKHKNLQTAHNTLDNKHQNLQTAHNTLDNKHKNLLTAHNNLRNWLENTKFPQIETDYALISKVYTRSQASQIFYSKNWLNNKFVTFRRDSNLAYVSKGTIVTDVQDVVDSVDVDEEDVDYLDQLEDDINDTVDDVEEEVGGLVDDVGGLFKAFGRR